MMEKMIEAHAANAGDARQREDFLSASEERPVLHEVSVADAGERGAGLGSGFVKSSEEFLAVGDFGRFEGGAANGSIIELLRFNSHGDPVGDGANMTGEPAERSGLFMGLPVPLFIRTAFQDLAGVLHFLVKFRQHGLSNGHTNLLCEIRDFSTPILGEQKANCQALLSK